MLEGAAGELRENAPTIYQELAGKRVTVEGSFRLLPDGTLGFHLGVFDPTIPLVIDPVLSYSTCIGGSSMDTVTSIAVDSSGNAYLAGWTVSTDLPTVNPVRAEWRRRGCVCGQAWSRRQHADLLHLPGWPRR